MVKTKKIALTPGIFFKILLVDYLKRRWWLLVSIWGLVLLILPLLQSNSIDQLFVVFVAIATSVYLVVHFWRYAHSRENKAYFLKRHYEIYTDRIDAFLEDDTVSTVKLVHFIKYAVIADSFLLYIAKNSYLYIPIDSFESTADLNWFKGEVLPRINAHAGAHQA
jgi:hypothetical protein